MLGLVAATALLALGASAQRPTNTSICDYYTTALLKENNATNQYTLLTLLVNTAVIGNYTQPNMNAVNGILNAGTYNGVNVDLLGFFNGTLASSNRGGMSGVAINFLDDGGAAPLKENKPANGTSSNQYKLLTHLYEFFGVLLGCSQVGMTGFPAYGGVTGMNSVHKFMYLDANQMGYFIEQVGLSAASFGVTKDDVTAAGTALTTLFDMRCSAPASIVPGAPAELQSMCEAPNCALAMNATCSAYANVTAPSAANSTNMSNGTSSSGNSSSSGTSTGSGSSSSSTKSSDAIRVGAQMFASVLAFFAFVMFL